MSLMPLVNGKDKTRDLFIPEDFVENIYEKIFSAVFLMLLFLCGINGKIFLIFFEVRKLFKGFLGKLPTATTKQRKIERSFIYLKKSPIFKKKAWVILMLFISYNVILIKKVLKR